MISESESTNCFREGLESTQASLSHSDFSKPIEFVRPKNEIDKYLRDSVLVPDSRQQGSSGSVTRETQNFFRPAHSSDHPQSDDQFFSASEGENEDMFGWGTSFD